MEILLIEVKFNHFENKNKMRVKILKQALNSFVPQTGGISFLFIFESFGDMAMVLGVKES